MSPTQSRARSGPSFRSARGPGVSQRVGSYRLPPDVAVRVRAGHPWVFRDALGSRDVVEPTGAVVELFSGNRDFVARGYVDRDHPVAVRVLSRDPDKRVHPGAGAIGTRFARAVQLRWLLLGGAGLESMRLFAGDSEGLPGVTVDRHGEFVVIQWLSAGALPWRDELLDAIEATVKPRGIYEQRRFRPLAGQSPPEPSVRARGDEAPIELVVEEAGCRFGIDVTAPLGVGLFSDLRLGRAAVAARAANRRVLNLFSYTGAFSVHAAKAGASEVVAVDLSAKVHARARRNFELSGLDPIKMEAITADTLKTVERFIERGRRFDLVVCDPPSFSQGPSGSFSVGKDLSRLASAAVGVLEPGGLLAFATNSVKVSAQDLDRALAEGAAARGSDLLIVDRVGLPADYPVAPGFPEGNYLKFVVALKV
ncbi:MAG: class I SAM-dependent rRNA methyltransferase [Pseudomonadota bacterium]